MCIAPKPERRLQLEAESESAVSGEAGSDPESEDGLDRHTVDSEPIGPSVRDPATPYEFGIRKNVGSLPMSRIMAVPYQKPGSMSAFVVGLG